jgi:4,5-DOPA dioxygenase extradiol
MSDRMPALFLSHGSPMLALEDEPTTRFLRRFPATLPKPSAIVVASAHWETDKPTVTGAPHPETIHDFHGFPKELYELRYAVPGDPRLAARQKTCSWTPASHRVSMPSAASITACGTHSC